MKIKREFVRNEREYKTSLSKLKGDNAAPFKIKELRKNFEKTVELFKNEYNFVVGGPSNQQTALYETSFLSCIIKLQKEMEVFLRYQKLHKRRIATANINDYEQVVHASNIRRFSLEKELALEEQDIESRHKQDVEKFNQCCKDTLADYDVTLNIKLEMFRNENNV
ncbi:hypothetical protein A3Q56_05969 [Intoshia linei]|uniref:Uncharacterized protein n=1 Tax=Intoshia linei TaxID=1819745 RepID=A0A177AWE4_9BILA|nr:hypothetical protein A3Q56_05969 [Intoshia linei]